MRVFRLPMLRLYNAVLLPFRIAVDLWARSPFRDRSRLGEWAERRARSLPSPPARGIWLHGASVGEARIVRGLAAALRHARPEIGLSVSAVTRTGRAQLPAAPEIDAAFYCPLDFAGWPARVLQAVRPAALVLVETELWPNLIREATRAAIPVAIANGRLSGRRMARYRRWAALYRPLLVSLTCVGVQTVEDAERFIALGAAPSAVHVTGNVKYDLLAPRVGPVALRARLGLAPDRPVLVAGSTGRGEDEIVLDAYAQVRRDQPEALLLLAPRHPERIDEVEDLARRRGRSVARLSASWAESAGIDTILVDTVGELPALYQLGAVAFVGGSLVPVGGHNLLEPAAVGVPVLFGPHVEQVRELAEALERAGAAERVQDGAQLARSLAALFADRGRSAEMGRRGRELVRANRGALGRNVELILDVADRARRRPAKRA